MDTAVNYLRHRASHSSRPVQERSRLFPPSVRSTLPSSNVAVPWPYKPTLHNGKTIFTLLDLNVFKKWYRRPKKGEKEVTHFHVRGWSSPLDRMNGEVQPPLEERGQDHSTHLNLRRASKRGGRFKKKKLKEKKAGMNYIRGVRR